MGGFVFICYSRADRSYVDLLAAHLRAAGIGVWFDHQMVTGDRFDQILKVKIDICSAFVVVMTPDAEESHWVGVEVIHALRLRKPIRPLLLRGMPLFSLNTIDYEDVSGARLPSAAFTTDLARLTGAAAPSPEPRRPPQSQREPQPRRRPSPPATPTGSRSRRGWTRRRLLLTAGAGAIATTGAACAALLRRDPSLIHTLAHDSPVTELAWSPHGGRLATSCHGSARIWDAETGAAIYVFRHADWIVKRWVWSVAWSPDGNLLAAGDDGGDARIYDTQTGEWVHSLDRRGGSVTQLAWSPPDGTRLATYDGSGAPKVRVWDPQSEDLVHAFDDGSGVWWSPDGSRVATGVYGGAALIYDAQTGERIQTLTDNSDGAYWVGWSPDGSRLATASSDGTLKTWDVETGKRIHTLAGHTDGMYEAVWSPGGERIATCSKDGTARIWSAETGDAVHILEHPTIVRALAWSPTGDRLATGCKDGTARVWNAKTGAQIQKLAENDGGPDIVAWAPDGAKLATGGGYRHVRIWSVAAIAADGPDSTGTALAEIAGGWSPPEHDGQIAVVKHV